MSSTPVQAIQLRAEVPYELGGQRLDQIAAQLFSDHSRSRLTGWIKEGRLTVDGAVLRPRDIVHGGSVLELDAEQEVQGDWVAQDIELNIVYEDDQLLVIDKPAGLVVHPAAGHADGTLLNALLHHVPGIEQVPRAGIVHRLDKDTTGLMVVAKTLESQNRLVQQLQARTVSRQYVAVAVGAVPPQGKVEAPIGRDPFNRIRMAVVKQGGKDALTHYQRLARLGPVSLVRLHLATGRTHQIRVHMAHLGFPLLGDPLYGRRLGRCVEWSDATAKIVSEFPRQALHAEKLSLIHPTTGEPCTWYAPWPEDFATLVQALGGPSYEDV